ncbi:putative nuclease [Feldmannia species virus]|uniref:Putative nuclease n=1 Tax=Feldmannia species virus TaxID=39420 RepID=B5LWN7_9PHYC|nr:putative nuclease [Feldmannia species virus]ACH46900.1 putative nuclease [Feldmannia species virus]
MTGGIKMSEPLCFRECVRYLPVHEGDIVFVCRVYDGDTCTLAWVDHAGRSVRSSCRIRDIDTPEMRGKSPEERKMASLAKERLQSAILEKFVTVWRPSSDKYGRILADLSTESIRSVSTYMLEMPDICKSYTGGKKTPWLSLPQRDR